MGNEVYDIIEDENGDVGVDENGDIAIGPSDDLHIKDAFVSCPGWWKQFVLIGLNPFKYINSRNTAQTLKNDATKQLIMIGYTDIKFPFDIAIDATGKITGEVNAQRK